MNKQLIFALSSLVLVGAGCGFRLRGGVVFTPPPPPSATVTVNAAPPPPTQGTVVVNAPQIGAGVQVVEATCVQGAAEQCNGLDDNCNGQIDEGCGYQSGAIQITLAWNTGADIDLYVTDPSGQTVSYQNTRLASGAMLDHDARGQCRANEANNTIENVYWNSPQPPRGQYQITLHYWGECGGAGPTLATTSISVGGRIYGVYNVTLTPQQRLPIATFTI
jgi:uncharacterized protein YfaP (DUF2135 family)